MSVSNEVTHRAGLGLEFYPDSPHCTAAVDYLVDQGALVSDERYDTLDFQDH